MRRALMAATGTRYLDGFRVDLMHSVGVPLLISTAALVRTLVAALRAGNAPSESRIGLTLTDDDRIAQLNEQHLGHPGPTDVLSFPLVPASSFPAHPGQDPAVRVVTFPAFVSPPGRRLDLGDIVVSVERAIEQAEGGRGGHTGDVRWSPRDELRLLITHGALHICGWDHIHADEQAAMRAVEQQLLSGGGAGGHDTGTRKLRVAGKQG
jgi:probable rRNA maturation factor